MPASKPTRYQWDAVKGRYFNPETGRTISTKTILKEIVKVANGSNRQMALLAQQLAGGNISLGVWQMAMLEQIKILHVATAAAGNGGWAQMSQSDWGFVGNRIKQQYKFLNRFAGQIKTGEQAINGQFFNRVHMYSDAGRQTFDQMQRRYEMLDNGMEEEMRELGEADHCDDCLEQAALGWQPIGTLDAIGDSVCKTNCHCTFKYRKHDEKGEWIETE